ncbi:P1 family peptidase [Sphaerobacter thermophilus]|uniref:Peptidase S58 DmpA n=1 Tax=Sphaerobacter thermophilus (strain ATCC 49802 / DSM 20745 / KCCM 41009 / NCIMB 13125 / S 6022) TaxID=479434 RepID=D1C570_SPHTD|nr:peptidase S58 DmpA [Sphaerobacter thermophilus DSM 20745]
MAVSGSRPRAREAGVVLGTLPPGPENTITDVAGVRVGHVTLIEGDGPLVPGQGPVRTGVTVILPHEGNVFREKVPAGIFVLNGFGKCLGQEQIDELGVIESPIALTGTMNVGVVADGLVEHAIRTNPDIGITTSTVNPVVGECSDAYLNDMQGRHVRQEHVLEAIAAASPGLVAEGCVGAGTGMSLFGFKGGIGTASRRLPERLGGYTVGALVLGNFGRRDQLTIAGVPVGRELAGWRPDAAPEPPESGSVMVILATDAPMLDRALRRLARRAALGLARTGSIAGHGSGDYIIAFSNAVRIPHEPSERVLTLPHIVEDGALIDGLFQAAVEATEEAVINALFAATTMTGRDGHVRYALPLDETLAILRRAGVVR